MYVCVTDERMHAISVEARKRKNKKRQKKNDPKLKLSSLYYCVCCSVSFSRT